MPKVKVQKGKDRTPSARTSPRKKKPRQKEPNFSQDDDERQQNEEEEEEQRDLQRSDDQSESGTNTNPQSEVESVDAFPVGKQSSGWFTEAQDEKIASYFEDLPAFYDMTNADYKNKVKKNALLKEFADKVGLDREYIYKFFWSF